MNYPIAHHLSIVGKFLIHVVFAFIIVFASGLHPV